MSEVTRRDKGSPEDPRSTGGNGLLLSSFVLIFLLAAAQLWIPFDRDQAFFFYFARFIRSGSALYRDIWDVKQPGIYLFYLAGGELFGYSERGIHLFEMCWMAATCGAVAWLASQMGISPRGRAWAVLLTVGAYYCAAWMWHFTQIETLVWLPLILSASVLSGRKPAAWRILAAGAAGGVVFVFKAILAPVVIAIWAGGTFFRMKDSPRSAKAVLFRNVILFAAGCGLPVGMIMAWAFHDGFLKELLWVTFRFPFEFAAAEAKAPFYSSFRSLHYLRVSLGWFALRFGAICGLAIFGAKTLWRRGSSHGLVLLLWFLISVPLIAVQSWWPYHLLLLLPPLGLTAAVGVDKILLINEPRRRRIYIIVAVLALILTLTPPALDKIRALIRHGVSMSPEERLAYQRELLPKWAGILDEVRFLSAPDALPGSIYAYDGPLYWLASGRAPANVPDAYQTPSQRARWPEAIIRSRPAYIRLSREIREALNKIDPDFQTFLDERYQRVSGHPPWYVRIESRPGPFPSE